MNVSRKRKRDWSSSEYPSMLEYLFGDHTIYLFNMLPAKSNLTLALVCKWFFSQLAPLINENYWFSDQSKFLIDSKSSSSLKLPVPIHFQHYQPTRLYTVPFICILPDNITHLYFLGVDEGIQHSTASLKLPPALVYFHSAKPFHLEPFPSTLRQVSLEQHWEQSDCGNMFSLPLTHVILKGKLNENAPLPNTVAYLILTNSLEQRIGTVETFILHNSLPANLTRLILPTFFNKPIKLPKSLTCLQFGIAFNQPIDELPRTLQRLRLPEDYSNTLPASIPPSLYQLEIPGASLNQWRSQLPTSSISDLTLLLNLYMNEGSCLPARLTHLVCHENTLLSLENLPATISHLELRGDHLKCPTAWPSALTHLRLLGVIQYFYWPPSITHLVLDPNIDICMANLPHSVTHISLTNSTRTFRIFQLPPNLLHLHLGELNNVDFPQLIPPNLTHLSLPMEFNAPLDFLPDSLTFLALGNLFSGSLPNPLPLSLTHLSIGTKFSQSLEHLPNSILALDLGKTYDYPILHPLPNLRRLYCGIPWAPAAYPHPHRDALVARVSSRGVRVIFYQHLYLGCKLVDYDGEISFNSLTDQIRMFN